MLDRKIRYVPFSLIHASILYHDNSSTLFFFGVGYKILVNNVFRSGKNCSCKIRPCSVASRDQRMSFNIQICVNKKYFDLLQNSLTAKFLIADAIQKLLQLFLGTQ